MWEVLAVSSRMESASSENPSCPMSYNTSGVVNNAPYACQRCCLFLSIRNSSIFSGSVSMSHLIFSDLEILF